MWVIGMLFEVGKLLVTRNESHTPPKGHTQMKAQIAAKYIQFLSNKKANKNAGFTLIELLVVIIIIGILSAIALPSFLNQAAKARGAEAKTNVGAMNRAQQAYFLENQVFAGTATASADAVPLLGLSMVATTENFEYEVLATAPAVSASQYGNSLKPDIKSYSGGTYYTAEGTTTILCESKDAGDAALRPASATACGTDDKVIQ